MPSRVIWIVYTIYKEERFVKMKERKNKMEIG